MLKFCAKCEVQHEVMTCAVKQDLFNPNLSTYHTIFSFDDEGTMLGQFQWNLKGIFLAGGCVQCRTPPALRNARIRNGLTAWTLSLTDGLLQIKIGDRVLYENKLEGQCRKLYSKTRRFAFYNMKCETTFSYLSNEMEIGDDMTSDCAGTCPLF